MLFKKNFIQIIIGSFVAASLSGCFGSDPVHRAAAPIESPTEPQATTPTPTPTPQAANPINISANNVAELRDVFDKHDFEWPPKEGAVPALFVQTLPDDFAAIRETQEKKSLFLRTLTPIVLAENRRIKEQRHLALTLLDQPSEQVQGEHKAWLENTLRRYKIDSTKLSKSEQIKQLKTRMDEIPVRLVLAQAAIESGWGTSRFALEGNSLFGQWTFGKSNGLTPESRDEGKTHKVAAFSTLQASVRAYMQNLNTNRAYRELRGIRTELRQNNGTLDANKMAAGLIRYSQRGEAYVKEVRTIIKSRTLSELNVANLQLSTAEPIDS